MFTLRDSTICLLFGIICLVLTANGQVNCPANADYRQGAGCYCRQGYVRNAQGTGCEDLNECSTGEHQCEGSAFCVNLEATYRCDCAPGFELYQVPSGFQCRDINECTLNPNVPICGTNQICENSPSSYRCNCKQGYSQAHNGAPCEDIDECFLRPWSCHPKAKCSNSLGGYNCTCNPGYKGDGNTCQDINECEDGNLCGGNALCVNTIGSFTCQCAELGGLAVVVKTGESCDGVTAEERFLAERNGENGVAVGVGVTVAVLVIIVLIIIIVVIIKRRKPRPKPIPGYGLNDGVEITPMGLDLPHYENIPTRLDGNYITVIADPMDMIPRDGPGNNFNDLYSNNKIVKAKNIYNENHLERRIPKVAMMPHHIHASHDPVKGTSYHETYGSQTNVVTAGVRPTDYDTYNMLWDKINRDIETIKPSLRSKGRKSGGVSRATSSASNYDHLGERGESVPPYTPPADYNRIYDRSAKTGF